MRSTAAMDAGGLDRLAGYATFVSSTLLRIAAYIFLRWIPGHTFPPVVIALFGIYAPSFFYRLAYTPPYQVISDEIDVITTDNFDHDEAQKDIDPRYVNGHGKGDVGEEIDVVETLVVEQRDPRPIRTLLTGLPSPGSLLWSAAAFTINLILTVMVLDYVYRVPVFYSAHDLSFARVGYVGDSTAKILVRETGASQYPIFASYRYADSPSTTRSGVHYDSSWKSVGQLNWLDNSTDFTGVFTVTGLRADTRYQYTVSSKHTGFFTTAPKRGQLSARAGRPSAFTFLHSSCLKYNFPYSPFEHPLANKGLRHLARALTTIEAQFMLFLGDFIYVDVPKRHGESSVEDYRREYRQVYASRDWPDAARELPWIHVYDDHEIANDWDKNTTGFFPAAFEPYQHYHTSVNPPAVRPGETYFEFTDGPATFFMLDTRRYRSPNDKTNGSDPITGQATKTMLGEQQLQDLLAWLKRPESPGVRWKVVVSSVPFTKNWWFSAQDTWRGYLGERQVILEAMWDVGLRGGVGVIILSGDRHEFAATAFPPPPGGKEVDTALGAIGKAAQKANLVPENVADRAVQTTRKYWPAGATVHEFSASPLNMFYLPIRTYQESSTHPDYISDVCIKYLPDGNSKFGAISISSPETSDQSILHYRLFIDGEETWSYTVTTPPLDSIEARNNPIWG